MKMNLERKKGIELALENTHLEIELKTKDRVLLQKIFKYIQTFELSEFETEDIRKELIGIAGQAEQRGEDLEQAIGKDYGRFVDELVVAATGKEIPQGRSDLRIAGTLMMVGSVVSFVKMLFFAYLIIAMLLSEEIIVFFFGIGGNTVYTWLHVSYMLAMAAGFGVLCLRAGYVGRRRCADTSVSRKCFRYGMLLFVLSVIDVVYTFVYGKMLEGATLEMIFLGWYLVRTIIIFFILIIYMIGARKNYEAVV